MKKNVLFSPLFLYNLALITHDATKSVNPSIETHTTHFILRLQFHKIDDFLLLQLSSSLRRKKKA